MFMFIAISKRASRWLRQEGLRGSYRKVRYVLRYWRFRWIVSRLQKQSHVRKVDQGFRESRPFPLISILLPAYRTRGSWLMEAVKSVRDQTFENWELCIGLFEVNSETQRELRVLAGKDERIRLFDLSENLGISANSNRLAKEARGQFLAVLDHDDYLEPRALQEIAFLGLSAKFDLIYTDEDIVSSIWKLPSPPNLKPDWAPDSFRSGNYICHFTCFRRTLFEGIGGFRTEYDGSQDYDLFLRLTEKTQRIAHIPKVLYHWRRHSLSTASGSDANAKPQAWEASRMALQSHVERLGEKARVEMGTAGTLRIRYTRSYDPRVDIVIPSTNRDNTLIRCLDSILHLTRYPNYRVTVMLNGGGSFDEIRKTYDGENRVHLRDYAEPFNFSRINNAAVDSCIGEVLVFLNDDIEVIDPEWLEGLLEHALRDKIGAVGPMLLYPNGTIQHAGISLDPVEVCWEFHRKLPQTGLGYHSRTQVIQNVSAVTGACLCTKRERFLEVGGFDEQFPFAYNDVDYCLKLLKKGYRNVYNPFVRLIHHESFTRGLDRGGEKFERLEREKEMMLIKWGAEGLQEHYFDAGLFRPAADLKRYATEYLDSPPVGDPC
jgi:GT2 family glycosyltransferase